MLDWISLEPVRHRSDCPAVTVDHRLGFL